MKNDFQKNYDEIVIHIRALTQKNQNIQSMNRKDLSNSQFIEQNNLFLQKQQNYINQLILSLQQNYLDPNKIRKIERLKNQTKKLLQKNADLLRTTLKKQQHYQIIPKTQCSPRLSQIQTIDHQLNQYIIAEENKQLNQIESKMHMVSNIMKDSMMMVYDQGEKVDIIEQKMVTTNNYVLNSYKQIKEADQFLKKKKKKYIILSIFTIIFAVTIFLLLLFYY